MTALENELNISDEKLNVLKIISQRGADNSTITLSQWLRQDIRMSVHEVEVIPFQDITQFIGGAEKPVVSILLRVLGDITGNALFIFPKDAAFTMVDIISQRPAGTSKEWGRLERSIMEETGNIVGTSFLNALVAMLDVNMVPTAPAFAYDMAGAIMQLVLMEYAEVADSALLIKTTFHRGRMTDGGSRFSGYFYLLPSPDSLKKFIDMIGKS